MTGSINSRAPLAAALAAGAAILLAGCAQPTVEEAKALKIDGGSVTDEAAREYRRLAYYEDTQMWDQSAALAFSEKALAAADGNISLKKLRDIPDDNADRAEIETAYGTMSELLAKGGGDIAPKAAGQAIAHLDCWAEQAAEGDQPLHISFCRDGFAAYATQTAEAVAAAGRPVSAGPPMKSYSVRFPLGSNVPDGTADPVIVEAARYALSTHGTQIVLGGHADRTGDVALNKQLSEERANTVSRLLQAQGVPAGKIITIGFGESYPRTVTPDGQRSDHNRRVEIVVGRTTRL